MGDVMGSGEEWFDGRCDGGWERDDLKGDVMGDGRGMI
jgi:uncharacterized protein YfiM (DUF2279 family)